MSSNDAPNQSRPDIPILLLKTRSQPNDTYQEYLSQPHSLNDVEAGTSVSFRPIFIPVLEHKQHEETLNELGALLKTGELKERYGGMIFTSQRAVEGWADTVLNTEKEAEFGDSEMKSVSTTTNGKSLSLDTATDSRTGATFQTDILTSTTFPLYVVGPATGRALSTLLSALPSSSFFQQLKPSIHGSDTGSGATLAPFMLQHYNALHSSLHYTHHDAPRLPFIPLLGMGSENYSRRRLESDDPRLRKRPLLFLVGETRRDVIPRMLMNEALGEQKIVVDEVEVYSTVVKAGFRAEFEGVVSTLCYDTASSRSNTSEVTLTAAAALQPAQVIVIVIFSPQGSADMLKAIGYLDESEDLTPKAKQRQHNAPLSDNSTGGGQDHRIPNPTFVIVTIGPTTRDHLITSFGFEPDVCAKKPSPEGIREGVETFLKSREMLG